MRVSFTVPGPPVSKARARIAEGGGMYTPKQTVEFEKSVRQYAALTMRQSSAKPFKGPVHVTAAFYVARPKSRKGQLYVTTKPDVDNYAKCLLDGMNKIVFADDAQVSALTVVKRYDDRPRTEISVTELEANIQVAA